VKFNMICIKFDQKIKKPKFWTFEVLKNLGFFQSLPALHVPHSWRCQCCSIMHFNNVVHWFD